MTKPWHPIKAQPTFIIPIMKIPNEKLYFLHEAKIVEKEENETKFITCGWLGHNIYTTNSFLNLLFIYI
jgi:hypothetical protein